MSYLRFFLTLAGWKRFFKILPKKEKTLFLFFSFIALISAIFLLSDLYIKNTKIAPAKGGVLTEGILGQLGYTNPLYLDSDADRDVTELLFSGLMKYGKNLEIVPDLVKDYSMQENGKVYIFSLKDNLFWQDNVKITSDDVIFTIKTIQGSEYRSYLQVNWIGVEVEKISDLDFKIILKKPYNAFLENCTVKIIPKHIWQNVSPQNFSFEYKLTPIGSGPYKIKKVKQDKQNYIKSLSLEINPLYHDKKPNILEVKFLFFDDKEDLLKAAKDKKISAYSLPPSENINQDWNNYYFTFPRYFAVFFNSSKAEIFKQKGIRMALNYATDKKELLKEIGYSGDYQALVDSPVLPEIYGASPPSEIYGYDLEKAKKILDEEGFKENQEGLMEKKIIKEGFSEFKSDLKEGSQGKEVGELQKCLAKFKDIYPEGEITNYFGQKTKEAVIKFQEKYAKDILEPWGFKNGTGLISGTTRDKLNEVCFKSNEESIPLIFSLVTINQPELITVAEILKQQWQKAGANIEVKALEKQELLQEVIKPREYQALLFGEVLGAMPDFYPYWHSSQKKDPGYNFSLYEDKKTDELILNMRESSLPGNDTEKFSELQDIIIENAPAVFLYCPAYIYSVSKEIKGLENKKITTPSKRFLDIENWYIKTRRVLK